MFLQRGPPVPVCLDIEEGDSPRKITLKQMIMHLENQLKEEKKRREQEKRGRERSERRCVQVENELDAMKKICKKVSLNLDSKHAWFVTQTLVSVFISETLLTRLSLAGSL